MVDALGTESVEGTGDIRWRAFLSGVGHRAESGEPCPLIDCSERFWRVAHFRAVEPDAEQLVVVGGRSLERGQGSFR